MAHLLRFCCLLLLVFFSRSLAAQTTFPAQFTGITSEWLTFDGQQRPTGRFTTQAISLKSSDAGTRVVLRQQLYDAAEVATLTAEMPAWIGADGPARLDVRAFLSPHLVKALQLKGLKIELDSLASLPAAASRLGDLLPETHLTLGESEGPTPRGVDIISEGRWIEDRETVTTPAGSFTCLRLNQNLRINTFTAGERRTYEARIVTWYAPETGIVKQATYYGSKLLDTSVLNRIIPPAGPATAEVRGR